jgi:CBS domain-containing protein
MATTERRHTIRELMTSDPVVLDASATVYDAARAMKKRDIGDVLVRRDGKLWGIVTDRDLVVRALAEDPENAARMLVGDIATTDIASVSPDTPTDDAIRLMRDKKVRRLPVVEGARPLGILSIGDLAVARDRESALAEISAAPPTR